MKQIKLAYYAPLLFFFTLLLDGQISFIMTNVAKGSYYAISMLTLLLFILGSVNLSKRYLIVAALILGLLSDSYYIGVLGINLLLFPLVTYYIYNIRKVILRNMFSQLMVFIITITVYQTLLMIIQSIFGLAKIKPIFLIASILGPSIILNVLLFLLLIYPLRWLFKIKNFSRKAVQ